MGRKTWDSLGRPLPGRLNIVITRRTDWQATGALRAGSFPEALKMARQALSPPNHTGMTDSPAKVFVIGGEQIYRQAMQDRPDVLHVTEVDIDVDGDAYFDRPSPHDWIETARVDFPVGPDRPLGFAIVEYRSRLTD
jgi:dihydrofolate reductase